MATITKLWPNGDELRITSFANHIEIESDTNPSEESRTLNFIVKTVDFELSHLVTVIQEGKEKDITVLGFGNTIFSTDDNKFITGDLGSVGEFEWEDIVQTPGSRYKGDFVPGEPLHLIGGNDIVIEGKEFGYGTQHRVIELYSCTNITIRNCYFHSSLVDFIYIDSSSNILIEDCMFERVTTGAVIHNSTGVVFRFNEAYNLQNNGDKIGCMVQYDKVHGENNYIGYNAIENDYGLSDPNDLINIFGSSGTEQSPLIMEHNWTRGGGPSETGGGLMTGDADGEWVIIRNNILVNPGQYGLAVAGGKNIILENNLLYGAPAWYNNVGYYAANPFPNEYDSYNLTIRNNKSNYKSEDGNDANFLFDEASFGGEIYGLSTNIKDSALSEDILPIKILNRIVGNANPGNKYMGNYISTTSSTYSNQDDFIIEGKEFIGTEGDQNTNALNLDNCNRVTIRNCRFYDYKLKNGISLYQCTNITIENCFFENVRTGMTVSRSSGINIIYNDFLNILGTKYSTEFGSAVQLIESSGPILISYNVVDNIIGEAEPEDIFNCFNSNGSIGNLITISNNWIRGYGVSSSGCGVNLGDGGGSYQLSENNVVVNAASSGVAITGGQNMTMRNNVVFAERIPGVSGTGMIVYNWYDSEGPFENITIYNNRANYMHRNGHKENYWAPDLSLVNVQGPVIIDDTALNKDILPAEIISRRFNN